MSVISMKQLLEAGVHFGHQTRRWNPKMKEYIFTERNGIYIIDLQKTVKKIEEAYYFVRSVAESNQSILFVGTKKQAQESIESEAKRCDMFFVNQRWLGGMLTNFKTIQGRIARLRQIEQWKPMAISICSQEGSHPAPRRTGKARKEPRRHQGYEEASRRVVRR